MKYLAVIPARSGSKGLRDKNIRLLNGKPLMAWSIEAARASGAFDTVLVSTDSAAYAEIAKACGAEVPFLRSAEAATDHASSWDLVLEVLEGCQRLGRRFDAVTLLQPTSPLRTAADILAAHRLLEEKNASAVVSVCETDHSPLWCNTLPEDGCLNGFVRPEARRPRQALEKYYRLNGAIFTLTVPALQRWRGLEYGPDCFAYVMPGERSVDIDGLTDFVLVEALMGTQDWEAV